MCKKQLENPRILYTSTEKSVKNHTDSVQNRSSDRVFPGFRQGKPCNSRDLQGFSNGCSNDSGVSPGSPQAKTDFSGLLAGNQQGTTGHVHMLPALNEQFLQWTRMLNEREARLLERERKLQEVLSERETNNFKNYPRLDIQEVIQDIKSDNSKIYSEVLKLRRENSGIKLLIDDLTSILETKNNKTFLERINPYLPLIAAVGTLLIARKTIKEIFSDHKIQQHVEAILKQVPEQEAVKVKQTISHIEKNWQSKIF
jgi:hypothetical protein